MPARQPSVSRGGACPGSNAGRTKSSAPFSPSRESATPDSRGASTTSARSAGLTLRYDKTSVARWVSKGMVPQGAAPHLIAAAIGQKLGRPVPLHEIGLADADPAPEVGLAFPRDVGAGGALGDRAVPAGPRGPPRRQRRHLAVAGRLVRGERVRDARLTVADNPGRQLGRRASASPRRAAPAHRSKSATATCGSCARPPRTPGAGTPSTAAATGVRRWCPSACGWRRRRCCSARTPTRWAARCSAPPPN